MAINVEAFYDAINSIAKRNVESSSADLTIDATIVEVHNADTGEYKVEYQANIFSAFSVDPKVTYNEGEHIYVLVPQGDFSAKKVIIGKSIIGDQISNPEIQDLTNHYIEEGPNWADKDHYRILTDNLNICACPEENRDQLNNPDRPYVNKPAPESGIKAFWEDQGFLRESPEKALIKFDAAVAKVDGNGVATEAVANEIKESDWVLWSKFEKQEDGTLICKDFEKEKERARKRIYSDDTRYSVYSDDKTLRVIDQSMTNYSKHYKFIKIGAKFRTLFSSPHSTGEYSLKVTFLVKNPKFTPEGTPTAEYNADEPEFLPMELKLGFKDFIGEPYRCTVPTLQKAYFEVPAGAIAGISKITLCQDGQMDVDYIVNQNDGSLTLDPDKANFFTNNIEVTDVDIRFCIKVNLLDTPYYCWIEEPEGNSLYKQNDPKFPFGREQITLVPHFICKTKEVTSECKVMWFREDLTIPSTNPKSPDETDRDPETGRDWLFYTGPGWRPIEHFIENPINAEDIANYVINEDGSLTVNIDAVPWQWRYMCVCVYKPDAYGSAKTTVTRADSIYDLAIEKHLNDNSSKTFLRVVDNKDYREKDDKVQWVGSWYVQTVDNSFTRGSDPYHYGSWDISKYVLNDHVLFRVAAYDPKQVCPPDGLYNKNNLVQSAPIGILEYETGFETNLELLIDWQGQKVFNFTALGQPYNKDKIVGCKLEPRIKWISDATSPYRMTIYAPDGMILGGGLTYTDSDDPKDQEESVGPAHVGYSPQGSMLQNLWVDHNNIVHFNVRDEYDPDRTQNTLKAVIYTIVEGVSYESQCEVTITKDGQNGTQGTGWTAPLKQTNGIPYKQFYNKATLVHARYSLPLPYSANPLVLEREGQSTTRFKQVPPPQGLRVYLRPFITKDGKALESLIESGAESRDYRAIIHWDVRYPQNARNRNAANASFLRICDVNTHLPKPVPNRDVPSLGKQVPAYGTAGGTGLQAITVWSGDSEDELLNTYGCEANQFGAVEIQYIPGAGIMDLTHEDVCYQFLVKASVDIECRRPSDGILGKVGADGGMDYLTKKTNGEWYRLKTITSWYPVDVFIYDTTNQNVAGGDSRPKFNPSIATINWPREISYDALGYNPVIDSSYLEFHYGYDPAAESPENGQFIVPEDDITPMIQSVEKIVEAKGIAEGMVIQDDEAGKQLKTDLDNQYKKNNAEAAVVDKLKVECYKLKPKTHLNWQEGTVGTLKGRVWYNDGAAADHNLTGWYYRNQVYTLNAYGNVDINGWDGQGIDIDEDNGTIFAPTIGAGYKGPFTNKFTGVLMGVNNGFKRDSGGTLQYKDIADQELQKYPYMTGLFGYQSGVSSFALLENGTAYFGRKDRGGRIIIDGYNATIYGGANGELKSPQIGDPMWNNMRLNLVDLTHNGEHPNVHGVSNGFAPDEYFGSDKAYNNDVFGVSKKLPPWYQYIWRNAFFCSPGNLPWWVDWPKQQNPELYHWNLKTNNKIVPVDSPECEVPNLTVGSSLGPHIRFPLDKVRTNPDDAQDEIHEPATSVPAFGSNKIYFVDYWSKDSLASIGKYAQVDPSSGRAQNLSTFGPSRCSTTPAIEIGQHPPGLMPGILPWGCAKQVFRQLWIPGDRNFMVTYDGTMWAMNGVFMGNVIGSNIVGGRMQGVEMGIGDVPDRNALEGIRVPDEKGIGNWKRLWAPLVRPLTDEEIQKIKGNWSVDQYGSAVAKDIKIFGGQIDLGSFHIQGLKNGTGENETDKSSVGNLLQYGVSDFVGPVHFYGNIGIGLAMNAEGMPDAGLIHTDQGGSPTSELPSSDVLQYSNAGNLLQTNGLAAFGIVLRHPTDKDLRTSIAHSWFAYDEIGQMKVDGPYAETDLVDGDPKIGTTTGSVQRGAMLAVDSLMTGEAYHDRYQGHFWPMYFSYNPEGNDYVQGKKVPTSYLTMMNMFKTTNFQLGSAGNGWHKYDALTNYARIGSFGLESQLLWFKKTWQDERSSIAPDPVRKTDKDDEKYLGWVGFQNRAGADGGAANPALGFSTAYGSPILIWGDGEMGMSNRGHVHFFAEFHGKNNEVSVSDLKNTFVHSKLGDGFMSGPPVDDAECGAGVLLDVGKGIAGTDLKGEDNYSDSVAIKGAYANKFTVKTANGNIGLSVEKDGEKAIFSKTRNVFEGVNAATENTSAGYLVIQPNTAQWGIKRLQEVTLCSNYDNHAWVHLRAADPKNPKAGQGHSWNPEVEFLQGTHQEWYSEIVIKPTAINITAPWALRFQMGIDPHYGLDAAEPKGFAYDHQQMVFLHDKGWTFGARKTWITENDTGPTLGGIWGTGVDSTVNFGIPAKGSIHGDPKEIWFMDSWAVPENQHNIYARFA